MVSKTLTTIILFFNIIPIIAQLEIAGYIYDKESKQAILGVRIYNYEARQNCLTDELGYFKITKILPGIYHLKISHIAYNDTVIEITVNQENHYNQLKDIFLTKNSEQIGEVNITAMRQQKLKENIPARIDIISNKEIDFYPNTNIDNCLQGIANVYVNRSWGIFSKNSSVTMRGLNGTSRVLVLLNGTPLNFSAGGGINWHMIESDLVERIEVLKGPASALYGNNAMGGVINIITKKDQNAFKADVNLFGGTYKTYGGKLNLASNYIKNSKGMYWSANAFYRQGDGYIIVPEDERDSTDTKLGLKEYSLGLSTGYQINQNNKIDFRFEYYDDKRDEGTQIYEKDGSYLKYTTKNYQGSYTGKAGGIDIYLKSFYHKQDYYQHSERLNQTGDSYKLYDRIQLSEDYGFWLNMVKKIFKNHEISFGSDYKRGSIYAQDIYFTSTDFYERGGNTNYYALFAQTESLFINEKLIINLGLRADLAQFRNGYLTVEDPTPVTAFETQFSTNYDETSWSDWSPKIAMQYKLNNKFRIYGSFSAGFMPPTLDDMVSSRKVSKGFKIANPYLKPETLINYETGLDIIPNHKLKFQVSTYYSIGHDFQYFVSNGDTVDIDKPVVRRENVGKAEIYGIETSAEMKIANYLVLKANYTYNQSKITEFNSDTKKEIENLTGKFLAETPSHQAYCGLFLTNKYINTSLVANYVGEMWADEFNTEKLDAYTTLDIRFQKQLKQFNVDLTIQNILDNQYIDKKNGLSPGRFIILEIGYHFAKSN